MTRVPAALLLVALALPARGDEGAPSLKVDPVVDGAVTGGALVVWGASELAKGSLAPVGCRWCGTTAVDAHVRSALRWSNPALAATLSDVLQLSVPAAVGVYDVLAARASGDVRAACADLLLVTQAVAISGVLTQAVKYATARQRPYAFYGVADLGRDDHLSFWSGHTSAAFSAAAAGGMVARLRGYDGWPWVLGVGFTAAAATGYLRIAADKHWLTDVLAASASATAVGLAVPWLHRSAPPVHVVLLPGGVALSGTLDVSADSR